MTTHPSSPHAPKPNAGGGKIDRVNPDSSLQDTIASDLSAPVPTTDETKVTNPDRVSPEQRSTAQTMLTQVAGAQPAPPPTGKRSRPVSDQTMSTDLHVETGVKYPAKTSSGSHHHQIWGDFELGELLGRGGMGSVYRGRQISLDRSVAVKVLPSHLGDNEGFKQRFMLEARAVAQISSPHVIQVYYAGVHEGHHYFAMEYVEGVDLAKKMKEGYRPSYREALELVTQAARGLVAAGEHNIVHRDIKPGNMMVTRKGLLKLMDFGLVRLTRSDDTGLTMAGTIMGTVSYFSPEQGRGERCDQRTDIYALGVVFYEMLTGKLPFTGGDATSVIYQHVHTPPKPPKEIDPNIPENYQAVALKCMQKNPDHRYQNAAELLSDLLDVAEGRQPTSAFIDPQGLRSGGAVVKHAAFAREKRRRRALVGVGLVGMAAAGVGAWWWTNQNNFGKSPSHPSPAPMASVSPPINQSTLIPADSNAGTGTSAVASSPATQQPSTVELPEGAGALERARHYLHAGNFAESRKLVDLNRQATPEDADWKELAGQLEQAQGKADLAVANAALGSGDFDAAGKAAIAAQSHLPDSPEVQAVLKQLAEREGARKQRTRSLEEADNLINEGNPAKAEELLTALQAAAPEDSTVAGALRRAHKMREDREALDQAVVGQLQQGDQALQRKDFDSALLSYTAAKQLDPKSTRATEGLERVTKTKQELVAVRDRFEQAIKERNLADAKQQLDEMRRIAPGSPTLVLAENEFGSSKLVEESQTRAVEERNQQLGALAKDLAAQMDDQKRSIPELEQGLKAFLERAGQDHPQRAQLEQKLEDRRQRLRVVEALAGLDAAMQRKDAPAMKAVVVEPGFAGALTELMAYPGLVFESRLDEFTRTGAAATAKVSLRHALAVYPERRLIYRYELRQDDKGWTITGARLQP